MIALETYAHHVERPALVSVAGVRVAEADNWVLGGPIRITPVKQVRPTEQGLPGNKKGDTRGLSDLGTKVTTVLFSFGSSTVSAAYARDLERLPHQGKYVVVGEASEPGSSTYNMILSAQRAAHVREIMVHATDKVSAPIALGATFASQQPSQYAKDQNVTVYKRK